MTIQKIYILTVPSADNTWIGIVHPNNSERVEVRKQQVVTVRHLVWLAIGTLCHLFFSLHAKKFPVCHVTQQHLVTHVMFDRHLIHNTGSLRFRHEKTCFRISIGRPHILKSTAPIVGDPQTPVLRVPGTVWVHIRCAGGVVNRHVFLLLGDLAMAAHKLHIVHIGIGRGHPLTAHGPGITGRGVDAKAIDQVPTAPAGLQDRLGGAHSGPSGAVFPEDQLGGNGVQADKGVPLPHPQGVAEQICSLGQIDSIAFIQSLLQGGGIIGNAIAIDSVISGIFPSLLRREITDLPEKLRFLRSRLPIHQCLPFRFALAQREVIPMEKGMEHILALFAPCHLTAVFSKQQLRHVTTPNIPQIDLSTTVILSRNPNGRASDIFHYAILPEQFLPVAVHHDISGGNVLEFHMA